MISETDEIEDYWR